MEDNSLPSIPVYCKVCWEKNNKNIELQQLNPWLPTPPFNNILFCPECKTEVEIKGKEIKLR